MSIKSQRGIVRHHLCMVCCVECTGKSLIIDLGVRSYTEKRVVIGWGLCPQCKRLADQGYVALVECDREKSDSPLDGELVHAGQVYRTGRVARVARVTRDVFCALFKVPSAPPIPCVFVEPGLLEKVDACGHQTLH